MDILPTDGLGAPARWLIVFRRTGAWWIPGRYKHVLAFAYVAECDTYVFYEVWWGATSIMLARGAGARRLMVEWTRDADVLAFSPRAAARIVKIALCCTTAIRHLVGLPGSALRPDALYRDLMRYGAVKVKWDQLKRPEPAPGHLLEQAPAPRLDRSFPESAPSSAAR